MPRHRRSIPGHLAVKWMARPQPNDTTVTKLSAEWRLLNKAEIDYLWRLNPGLGPAKSERHVRAGRMRHVRQPTRGA